MPPGVETIGLRGESRGLPEGPERHDDLLAALWPLGRGLLARRKGAELGAEVDQVAGKVGYALPPGGHPELAAGFALSVASTSKKKEAAYLFIQWLNSEEISLSGCSCPTRCAIRSATSHYASAGVSRKRGRMRKDYLAALKAGRARPACSTCR